MGLPDEHIWLQSRLRLKINLNPLATTWSPAGPLRKFAAGRRSVRRRRRARAPGVRWAYFLRLNIRVLIFLLSGLVLSRLFRTNLTVTVGYYGDRCAAAPRAESSPKLSGQGGLGGTSTTKVGPAWATRQNIIFVVSGVLELHSPLSIDPGSVTLCCPWYYAVLAL